MTLRLKYLGDGCTSGVDSQGPGALLGVLTDEIRAPAPRGRPEPEPHRACCSVCYFRPSVLQGAMPPPGLPSAFAWKPLAHLQRPAPHPPPSLPLPHRGLPAPSSLELVKHDTTSCLLVLLFLPPRLPPQSMTKGTPAFSRSSAPSTGVTKQLEGKLCQMDGQTNLR